MQSKVYIRRNTRNELVWTYALLDLTTLLESLHFTFEGSDAFLVILQSSLICVQCLKIRVRKIWQRRTEFRYLSNFLEDLSLSNQGFMPSCEILVSSSTLGLFEKLLGTHSGELRHFVLGQKRAGNTNGP